MNEASDRNLSQGSGDMPMFSMNAMSNQDQMPDFDMNSTTANSAAAPGQMPSFSMNSTAPQAPEMQPQGMSSGSETSGGLQSVLVEVRVPKTQSMAAMQFVQERTIASLQLDESYTPIPVEPSPEMVALFGADEAVVVVRGQIEANQIAALEAQPNVVKVYQDAPIAPFASQLLEKNSATLVQPTAPTAACPIGTCDCDPATAKGTIAEVAAYLGVDQIWAAGYRGEGIVVAVVDGGITAEGRPVIPGETSRRIPRVIGGWPTADWGTQAASWGEHGNMCATDVLGMAPQAQIYDIRLSGDAISAALAGFQWAIEQHRIDGTPQILTNSWGIFQESWDRVYARDPNHPFTRKVVEAINEGILVLFAAGNCGSTCPSGRCGRDSGPGRSIWGANGHPLVMTVGAVNKNEQFVGYSSQGPAALDPQKPDFCSITHFRGYFSSDTGTSAATPIAAGVVALLKQVNPALTQDQAKQALRSTAKDIGATGWDQHSGTGIIQAKAAFDRAAGRWSDWANLGGYCTYGVAAASWAANRLDTFVIGGDSAVYHKYWDGSAWSDWGSLGGYCLSAPAAVSWGPNRIDAFVLGGDRAMFHKYWDGSAWSDWGSLGGYCTYGVAAASWAPNRLDTFVIGGDSAVYHKYWDGAAWSDWGSLGGYCLSAPAAVSWGPNRIDLFVIGGDRALFHKYWDGSAWSDWGSLGGYCTYGVAASSWAANRLDVFVIGGDSAMYRKSWNGSAWSDWERHDSFCLSAPGAVSWGPGRIDAFVLGGDRAVYHKWFG
jgi:subtilisin family serine protease